MIVALDSSFDIPTEDQARAARAAGVGFWWGYLATMQRPGAFNLANPWPLQGFLNVQRAGLGSGAFVSGWDDPVGLRQLAQAWGIPLIALDDEDAIRPLSSPDWRPAFLAAAGAGLYGLLSRHTIPAPFRIAALYPAGGCTDATWPTSPASSEPHGWQCQGTHTDPVTGLSVDRAALDDWFGGQTMALAGLDPSDATVGVLLKFISDLEYALIVDEPPFSGPKGEVLIRLRALAGAEGTTQQALAALKTELDQVQGALAGAGGSVDLSRVYAELGALGKHLGVDVTTGQDT